VANATFCSRLSALFGRGWVEDRNPVLLRALLRASRQRQRRRRTSDQYTDYEIATLHSTTSPPLAPSGAERQQYAITFTQPSVRNLLKDRSRAGETMSRYRVCLFNRFGSLFFANVFECA
jgi:hypothetical protein